MDPNGHDPVYAARAQANSADCADYYYSGTSQTHNPLMTGRIGSYCKWQYPCIEDWAQPGRAAPPRPMPVGNLGDLLAGLLSSFAPFTPGCALDLCQQALAIVSNPNTANFQSGQARGPARLR